MAGDRLEERISAKGDQQALSVSVKGGELWKMMCGA